MTDDRDAELSKLRKELRIMVRRLDQCQRNRKELGYLKDKLDHVLLREEEARLEIEQKRAELVELNERLSMERKRSIALLESLVPIPIAQQLRESGKTQTCIASRSTVLCADLVDYSTIAQRMAPQDIVAALDLLFSQYGSVAVRNGMEPLRSTGGLFRCVGGLFASEPNEQHIARAAVNTALEIIETTRQHACYLTPQGMSWHLRVGIHAGPVVGGLVGDHRLSFDIFGETVELAWALCQASEAGRVHVSREVARACDGVFDVVARSPASDKDGNPVEMYWVSP